MSAIDWVVSGAASMTVFIRSVDAAAAAHVDDLLDDHGRVLARQAGHAAFGPSGGVLAMADHAILERGLAPEPDRLGRESRPDLRLGSAGPGVWRTRRRTQRRCHPERGSRARGAVQLCHLALPVLLRSAATPLPRARQDAGRGCRAIRAIADERTQGFNHSRSRPASECVAADQLFVDDEARGRQQVVVR